MKLTVLQRFKLLNILPAEGNFSTLRIVRELREALSFTEEEHAAFGMEDDREQGVTRWDPSLARDREYNFAARARKVIADALGVMDQQGRLTMDLMDLAELFLDAPADDEGLAVRRGDMGPAAGQNGHAEPALAG